MSPKTEVSCFLYMVGVWVFCYPALIFLPVMKHPNFPVLLESFFSIVHSDDASGIISIYHVSRKIPLGVFHSTLLGCYTGQTFNNNNQYLLDNFALQDNVLARFICYL